MRQVIDIKDEREAQILKSLESQNDFKSLRLKKMLALPDLSRKPNSPIKFIVEKVTELPRFKNFDIVSFPKIVDVKDNFDLLNTPKDHPSRRESDTYYVDKNSVLRTQTTVVWPYYYKHPDIVKKLKNDGEAGCLSFGTVFRKDEIDRKHFPAFHQIDGVYICEKKKKTLTQKDLQDVLADIVKSLYGNNVEFKFLPDEFPFTYDSTQIEVMVNGSWLEILGAGLTHPTVMKNLGIDPEIYNGWAFGFGLDRLAMIKNNIHDIRILWSDDPRITKQFTNIDSQFTEVSKYPSTLRDISFIVDKNESLNNYFEIVREMAGNLIEEVTLLDKFENESKFGKGKISYTFRIVYRSPERTLTNDEVNVIQDKIREKTASELKAVLR